MTSGKAKNRWRAYALALPVCLGPAVVVTPSAQAQTYSILYSFRSRGGEHPRGGLVQDATGNLYGTTLDGGEVTGCGGNQGCGTVFRLSTSGKEKVLHSFVGGGADGAYPYAGLVRDAAGNLYGTTYYGGDTSCGNGCGTVFKVDRTGKEFVLHTFVGEPTDGDNPSASLLLDAGGNLYGTTYRGGEFGYGAVFKVDATGKSTVLHSFTGDFGGETDGAYPYAGLVADAAGNLYGTTYQGGTFNLGTVFTLGATGKETVLYSFAGPPLDGKSPYAGLVRDPSGNLYGTTLDGGASGAGTVFMLDATGNATVLHSFSGGATDGGSPYAGLVRDPVGNLYGTTYYGGAFNAGTVFEVTASGTETVLHSFVGGGTDGAYPLAGLVRDAAGNLYGTTEEGGGYYGAVFKLTP